MSIRRNEVVKLARLARLGFSDQELDEFVPQFREIIGYVDQLEELPTQGVEPLYQALGAEERQEGTRPDEVRPSLPRQAALQNAPQTKEGQFQVPKVIE
ncbi:MAG: Asp-tRNA(Asn)/Glu-tRNA(Gln) amidotransferase subunit GatC [Acidobacteriota bacterium]